MDDPKLYTREEAKDIYAEGLSVGLNLGRTLGSDERHALREALREALDGWEFAAHKGEFLGKTHDEAEAIARLRALLARKKRAE